MSEELRKTIMDAMRSVSERADEFKAGCATFDGEWPDAEDKAIYDAEVALVERLRVALTAISDAGQAPEPDCWAILTPNGSRLVSPEEAKGRRDAYPLYAAPVAADAAAPSLTTEQLEEIAEGREILSDLIENIEKHGPYSAEATITFLRQALNCLPSVI